MMTKLNLQSKLKQNTSIFANQIDNEMVMLNVDLGKYFGMNEVASDIWKILEQKTSVEMLYQQLATEYDISVQKCQEDVEPFLHQLISNGLIEIVETQHA